jgi:hypothetical protein
MNVFQVGYLLHIQALQFRIPVRDRLSLHMHRLDFKINWLFEYLMALFNCINYVESDSVAYKRRIAKNV